MTAVYLQAAGKNFNDYPSAAPGIGYSNGWTFSILFPAAGSFDIVVGGGWSATNVISSGSEIAYRDCMSNGGGRLSCSSWQYSYPQYEDFSSTDGSFDGKSITINVTAVPEPMTAALWLAGLGCLLTASRRRRP